MGHHDLLSRSPPLVGGSRHLWPTCFYSCCQLNLAPFGTVFLVSMVCMDCYKFTHYVPSGRTVVPVNPGDLDLVCNLRTPDLEHLKFYVA